MSNEEIPRGKILLVNVLPADNNNVDSVNCPQKIQKRKTNKDVKRVKRKNKVSLNRI